MLKRKNRNFSTFRLNPKPFLHFVSQTLILNSYPILVCVASFLFWKSSWKKTSFGSKINRVTFRELFYIPIHNMISGTKKSRLHFLGVFLVKKGRAKEILNLAFTSMYLDEKHSIQECRKILSLPWWSTNLLVQPYDISI